MSAAHEDQHCESISGTRDLLIHWCMLTQADALSGFKENMAVATCLCFPLAHHLSWPALEQFDGWGPLSG